MFGTTRGTRIPAGKSLAALVLALLAAAPTVARADDGLVDVRTLPRLEGAVIEPKPNDQHPQLGLAYKVPMPLADMIAGVGKLLAADGWVQYAMPFENSSRVGVFKKGPYGLHLFYMTDGTRTDSSAVDYSSDRLYVNLPFPEAATNIVYDARRPYLGCISPANIEASRDFFQNKLVELGWSSMSAADITAHWPNADIDNKAENGTRAYYSRDVNDGGPKQPPIMLSLQRRDDGKTDVEIKVAPFALPQNLELAKEEIGLPVPTHTPSFGSTGSSDSDRRKLEGTMIAEIPAVLAFYRRELAARDWKEEAGGSAVTPDQVSINFSTADQNATLRLSRKYDMTVVSLTTQVKESALAARAKAKKEADQNFMRDAEATAKQMMAADEIRRAAQAATLSNAPLQALADKSTPVPLPEGAENVEFNGPDGKLEFNSSSTVKALADFYRGSLKPLGWKEQPSVINKSNMVVMEFSKGGKTLSFTVMQMGPKVEVSADGSGLVMANAKPDTATAEASNGPAANAAVQNLEAEPDSALPVPKQHTMSSLGVGKLPGTETAIRRELNASIPADLNSVLAFYRGELAKLGWKEATERAVVKPDQAQLAFASPDGPGHPETRPQQRRDVGRSGTEIPRRRGEGGDHAQARSIQADVRQWRRQRGCHHHQQADDQDRRRRRRTARQGPDARSAAGQIPGFAEGRRRPRPQQRDRGGRRRHLGADGGPRRKRDTAAGVLIRPDVTLPCRIAKKRTAMAARPSRKSGLTGPGTPLRITLFQASGIGLSAP